MKTGTLLLSIALCLPNGPLVGQGSATDAWPTYAGDYSQRRLAAGPDAGEGSWFGPPPGPPAITGGVAEQPVTMPGATSGSPRLSGSILQVNGIVYVSSPDNAWAVDALDGHVLWH